MKARIRFLVLTLAAVMFTGLFAGCGKGPGEDPVDFDNLPDIDRTEQVTLKIWVPMDRWAPNATYDKNDAYKAVAEKLNLKLEFTHPPVGQESEAYNLMIVDRNLPDLIFPGNWYRGGPGAGVQDGIFKELTGYLPKYAPDYYKVLQDRPDIRREVITDQGKYAAVYGVSLEEEYCYSGPIWNKKALDKVGESAPITITDWERVLTKFKNQLGMTAPMAVHPLGVQYTEGAILSAYGVGNAFYQDPATHTVKYGPMESGYYEYLNLMRKWYKAGLIDPNFETRLWESTIDNFKKEKTGIEFNNPANAKTHYGEYGVDWIDGPYPVMNAGDRLNIRLKNWNALSSNSANWNTCAAISKDCANIDRALDFLNYGFTDEGRLLYNYGTEGKSYNIDRETGKPVFTDIWFTNQNGISLYDALYTYKCHMGVFIREERYANPVIMTDPRLTEIMKRWTEDAGSEALIPPITFNETEQINIDIYYTDINQYVVEQQVAFITGKKSDLGTDTTSMSSAFRTNLTNMGTDVIIGYVQSAYNRYLSRI